MTPKFKTRVGLDFWLAHHGYQLTELDYLDGASLPFTLLVAGYQQRIGWGDYRTEITGLFAQDHCGNAVYELPLGIFNEEDLLDAVEADLEEQARDKQYEAESRRFDEESC